MLLCNMLCYIFLSFFGYSVPSNLMIIQRRMVLVIRTVTHIVLVQEQTIEQVYKTEQIETKGY